MDKTYWIRRQQAAVAMAQAALSSEARLVHYELAGRYSLRAVRGLPFMLLAKGPVSQSEASAIRAAPPEARGAEGNSPPRRLPPRDARR